MCALGVSPAAGRSRSAGATVLVTVGLSTSKASMAGVPVSQDRVEDELEGVGRSGSRQAIIGSCWDSDFSRDVGSHSRGFAERLAYLFRGRSLPPLRGGEKCQRALWQ